MLDLIHTIADENYFLEIHQHYAKNIIVGFARLDGRPVGIIANQPRVLGGCLCAESSQKGAWFVDMCDRFGLPLVVLVDTPGFLPGATQERDGVLRHGASLLRAFGRATVPRLTVTLRQAFGGAHIVMNSRDLGADLTLAWPGARIGVMGAPQAVGLVRRREIAAGADASALSAAYEAEHLPVDVSARAGFVDEVIAPDRTRVRLIAELEGLGAWR
jgi:acetyl-CoA carboxylase carboxyltransferase component